LLGWLAGWGGALVIPGSDRGMWDVLNDSVGRARSWTSSTYEMVTPRAIVRLRDHCQGCGEIIPGLARVSKEPRFGQHVSELCRDCRGFTRRDAQPWVHQTRNESKPTLMHQRTEKYGSGILCPGRGLWPDCPRLARVSMEPRVGHRVSELCRNRRGFTRRVAQPWVHQTRNGRKPTLMHLMTDKYGSGLFEPGKRALARLRPADTGPQDSLFGHHVTELFGNRRGFTRHVALPWVHQGRHENKPTLLYHKSDSKRCGLLRPGSGLWRYVFPAGAGLDCSAGRVSCV
jgi:hypothetical protein